VRLTADIDVSVGGFHLDAAITADSGETIALVGPNGAGKTTLLRVLAGVVPLDRGRITLDEQVFDEPEQGIFVPSEQRSVGVVFQEYLLFGHMSVRDNIAFGLRAHGIGRTQARVAAQTWLDRFDLADKARARPKQLSGGQAQRVALARALATSPKMLLLDEPMAALDAGARSAVRSDLRRHLAAFDGIRIIVTHELLDAAALADRLVVLEDGRVSQAGSLAEIAASPRSRYVADLVGVNLVHGVARGDHVDLGNGSALVVADAGTGDVFATIHPHSVALFRHQPEGSPRNVFPGTVASIEPLGSRVRVALTGVLPLVAEVTPTAVHDLALEEGSSIWAMVKATDITVFSA
jgi:molybdate transport system ATP-binding protein